MQRTPSSESPSGSLSDDVREAERRALQERREAQGVAADARGIAGLAISGGGVRSATFALGVVQALAREGLLERFDYLSTVSGGGYLGSSLTWMSSQQASDPPQPGVAREDFPYGCDDVEQGGEEGDAHWQRQLLQYLRSHSAYLTPGGGITALSGLAVVLRGIGVHLLIWLPLLATAFLPALRWDPGAPARLWGAEIAAAAAVGLFFVACAVYAWATAGQRPGPTGQQGLDRYRARRFFETHAGWWLLVVAGLVVLASVPRVHELLAGQSAAGGVASLAGGALSALSAFRGNAREGSSWLPPSLTASLGAALVLYGLALLGFALAVALAPGSPGQGWPASWSPVAGWPQGLVLAVLLVLSLYLGAKANLNYIGLHRFYRDRLMESYLPELEDALALRTGPSPRGDAARLSDMSGAAHRGPYHLINSNVVLVDSEDPEWRLRGGDSFVLSPLFCGSPATGWMPTGEFMDDGMTLATAMAISGAAVHPNTGVGGVGPMRSRAVSTLMALLNVRLGYWAPNPARKKRGRSSPRPFGALWRALLARGFDERQPYIELSDGGHFENLGVYELVRRECDLIVAIDGGADLHFAFGDLRNCAERIEADFDVRLEWDQLDGRNLLLDLVPAAHDPIANAKLSGRSFVSATLRRGSRTVGKLVYVKSSLTKHTGLRVKGYKRDHPHFPDETTADQFFDESQFEAYRRLGHGIGRQVAEAFARLDARETAG